MCLRMVEEIHVAIMASNQIDEVREERLRRRRERQQLRRERETSEERQERFANVGLNFSL